MPTGDYRESEFSGLISNADSVGQLSVYLDGMAVAIRIKSITRAESLSSEGSHLPTETWIFGSVADKGWFAYAPASQFDKQTLKKCVVAAQ